MQAPRGAALPGVLVVLLVAALGCSTGPAASPTPRTVNVTLQEWAIGTDATSSGAGTITFAVTNKGPEDVHELVVVKTDLSLIALPTDANGAVTEEAGGMKVIGEIEDIPVGASRQLEVTLEPGAYALICNIYDETEKEAHYQKGMRASFIVS